MSRFHEGTEHRLCCSCSTGFSSTSYVFVHYLSNRPMNEPINDILTFGNFIHFQTNKRVIRLTQRIPRCPLPRFPKHYTTLDLSFSLDRYFLLLAKISSSKKSFLSVRKKEVQDHRKCQSSYLDLRSRTALLLLI